MSKKILSLFLIFAVLTGVMGFTPTYAQQHIYEGLLLNLGIIQQTRDTEKTISREEFAGILIRLLKMSTGAIENNPFKVEETQKDGASAMYATYQSGYMKLMEKGEFGANYPVTYDEAIYALIKALGYDVTASSKDDYFYKATSTGLIIGIKYERNIPVSYGDMTKLLSNALQIDLMKQTVFGTEIKYETKKGVNLLSEKFDVYKTTGIVSGTSTATLGIFYKSIREDQLLIEDEIYNYKGLAGNWLGLSAEVYYYQGENDEEKTIIYITERNNDILELNFNKISQDSTKSSFKYEFEGSMEEAVINNSADLIYNNKNVDFTADFPLYIPDSTAKLIDNDNDGSYDVVIISSYVNYYVSSVSTEDMVLRDKYGQQVITLDNIKKVHVYMAKKEVDFSKIKPGNAISVVANAEILDANGYKGIDVNNSSVYYIYINEEKASGKVDEIRQDGLIINKTEYKYSQSLKRAIYKGKATEIALGASVTAFIDMCGNIMAYESKGAEGEHYGYLIDAKEVKAPFENKFSVKLLDQNGIVEVYDVSDKVELDGDKLNKSNSLTELKNRIIKNGIVDRSLIRFKTNSENIITMLDTAYLQNGKEIKETSLIKNHSGIGATLYYNKDAGKIFGGKVIIGDTAKVFVVPDPSDNTAQSDDYYITDESYFGTTGDYYIDSYNSTIRVSNLIVAYDKANFSNTLPAIVITGLGTTVNADNENVTVIKGFSDGKEVNLPLKSSNVKVYNGNSKIPLSGFNFSTFNKGDVVRCLTDKQNRITSIQYLFNIKNTGAYGASGTNYDSSYRTIYARAIDMNEQILEISTSSDLSSENDTEAFVLTGTPIYEFNNDKIYNIGIESISTYKPNEISNLASNIFIFSSRSKAKIVLVIK